MTDRQPTEHRDAHAGEMIVENVEDRSLPTFGLGGAAELADRDACQAIEASGPPKLGQRLGQS